MIVYGKPNVPCIDRYSMPQQIAMSYRIGPSFEALRRVSFRRAVLGLASL